MKVDVTPLPDDPAYRAMVARLGSAGFQAFPAVWHASLVPALVRHHDDLVEWITLSPIGPQLGLRATTLPLVDPGAALFADVDWYFGRLDVLADWVLRPPVGEATWPLHR